MPCATNEPICWTGMLNLFLIRPLAKFVSDASMNVLFYSSMSTLTKQSFRQ